jgi:hypothetical protein
LVHISGFMDFLSPQIQDLIMPADIIILQRNLLHPILFDAMRYFQGMGKPCVVDLDDAYQSLPWSNPAKPFWHLNPFQNPEGVTEPGGALKMLEEGLRLSNGLVAPNRLLLKDFEYASGNSYYLQNYAEPEWWTNLPDRQTLKQERGFEDRIVIGWGGSVSHYDSFWGSGVRQAAERICKRHPEVLWLICGNDRRVFDQLPVDRLQKATQGGVPPQEWPRTVASFDIGVAPLFGPYDQRRSWIKGIEYLLGGVPWIGTEGEPYRDLEGLGTLTPGGVEAWEDALEAKITNLKREQERALSLVPLARERFIADNQLETFRTVFEQIKQDFSTNLNGLPGVVYVKPPVGEGNGSQDQSKEETATTEVAHSVEAVPA